MIQSTTKPIFQGISDNMTPNPEVGTSWWTHPRFFFRLPWPYACQAPQHLDTAFLLHPQSIFDKFDLYQYREVFLKSTTSVSLG